MSLKSKKFISCFLTFYFGIVFKLQSGKNPMEIEQLVQKIWTVEGLQKQQETKESICFVWLYLEISIHKFRLILLGHILSIFSLILILNFVKKLHVTWKRKYVNAIYCKKIKLSFSIFFSCFFNFSGPYLKMVHSNKCIVLMCLGECTHMYYETAYKINQNKNRKKKNNKSSNKTKNTVYVTTCMTDKG